QLSRTPGQRSSARSTPYDHDAELQLAQQYVGTKRRRDAFDTERLVSNAQAPPTTLRQRKRARRERAEIAPAEEGIVEPGEEFNKLYTRAMKCFLSENDIEQAQQLAVRAIAENPEVFAAHNLLADIYHALDDDETAMDILMTGAHGHMNNVVIWQQVAEKILGDFGVAHQNRIERAIYCFSAILRKNPEDTHARFQRAELARELGNWNRAYSDLEIILEQDPHNSKIMSIFKQVCYDVGDLTRAREAYEEYFKHYEEVGISEEEHYTWEDIGNYSDLIADGGDIPQAIATAKRLARFLCNRGHEDYWELYTDDDRELDQYHLPRRVQVSQFDGQLCEEDAYGEVVPLDLRAKLGILRLNVKLYDKALEYFHALHGKDIDLGFQFWSLFGASAYIAGNKELAIQCYENAVEVEPEAINERTQLSKLYRDTGDRVKSLKYGRQAVQMAQEIALTSGGRKYERRDDRISREQAENTLRRAYRMPKDNTKRAGKVPQDLRGRRGRGTFTRYIPRDTTVPRGTPTPRTPAFVASGTPENATNVDDSPRKKRKSYAQPQQKNAPLGADDPSHEHGRVKNLYQTLLECQPAMREGDELATNTWMNCGEALLGEHFVTIKAFFPPERKDRFTGF
ncbi:hypothetical protein LTR66_017030, partial [Elasticomyces elasticus]